MGRGFNGTTRQRSRWRFRSQWPQGTSSGRTSRASTRDAHHQGKAELAERAERAEQERREAARRDRRGRGDQAAGLADRPDDPRAQAVPRRLLAGAGSSGRRCSRRPTATSSTNRKYGTFQSSPSAPRPGDEHAGASPPARRHRSGPSSRPGSRTPNGSRSDEHQDEEDADRHDEPALNLVRARQRPDVGRLGVGPGDHGRDVAGPRTRPGIRRSRRRRVSTSVHRRRREKTRSVCVTSIRA